MKMLTDQHGKILINLARQTIEQHLGMMPTAPVGTDLLNDPALHAHRAVFVTLNKRGQLRGCIGSLLGTESILDGVRRHAVNAAFHDHRFTPVTIDEVRELTIDISVLSEPKPLAYTDSADLVARLRPGVDGVILSDGSWASATFLPQVWGQLPAPEHFLGHLCRKAGLPDDAWRKKRLTIQTYQVQHFTE
jgi:AmmeMemoRadiSam system protein A